MAAKGRALSIVLAIVACFASTSVFASIPRSSILEAPPAIDFHHLDVDVDVDASIDNAELLHHAIDGALIAPAPVESLSETRVWVSRLERPLIDQAPPLLTHALLRSSAAAWSEIASGTTVLTPDPLGYQDSSNLYAFAGGDPVNGRDPLGRAKKTNRVPSRVVVSIVDTLITEPARAIGPAIKGAADFVTDYVRMHIGDRRATERFTQSVTAASNMPGFVAEETSRDLVEVSRASLQPVQTVEDLSRLPREEVEDIMVHSTGKTAAIAVIFEGVGAEIPIALETVPARVRTSKPARTGRANSIPEQGPFVVTPRGVAASTQGSVGRVTPPGVPFGTTTFGNKIQQPIAEWLQARYPNTQFRFQTAPGETGIDVRVVGGDDPGFRFADIKPRSQSGYKKYIKQVEDTWGLPRGQTRAITYDADGNIWIEW